MTLTDILKKLHKEIYGHNKALYIKWVKGQCRHLCITCPYKKEMNCIEEMSEAKITEYINNKSEKVQE